MHLSANWRAFAVALAIGVIVSHGTTAQRECTPPRVRDAIVAAVKARMGDAAEVTLGECIVRGVMADVAVPARIVAVPDVGARTGGSARFLLFEGADRASGRRAGSVDVELHVTLPHVRARRTLAPRTTAVHEDLEAVTGDVGRLPIAALPDETTIVGARIVRPVPAGRPIVASMLAETPLVRSGDEVQTVVRVGALEARGTAIAAQTGTLGSEIRVVNADSRRALRARVIGRGEVEVMHER